MKIHELSHQIRQSMPYQIVIHRTHGDFLVEVRGREYATLCRYVSRATNIKGKPRMPTDQMLNSWSSRNRHERNEKTESNKTEISVYLYADDGIGITEYITALERFGRWLEKNQFQAVLDKSL